MAIRSHHHRLLHSFSPSSNTANNNTLITTAVSILQSHRRRSRFNHLKSLLPPSGISPSESSSIILRLRNNPRLALRFFLWTLHLSLCTHTLSSFSTIIHTLARSRLRSSSLSLLRSALRSFPHTPPSSFLRTLSLTYRPSHSAPFVFDLLIQAYLHSRNLDPALFVFRSLRSRGVNPLTSTANSLIRTAAKVAGAGAAMELYREVVETVTPNSRTFNTLLLAVYRDGRGDLSGEVLTEMDRFKCGGNVFTYSIRMAGCADVAEAERLWKEMAETGIKPDATAWNTLMRRYWEAGEVGKGEEVYCEMGRAGLEATAAAMEIVMEGRYRAGDVEGAGAVYGEMRTRGMAPAGEVVDEVVCGLCERGMVEEGLGVMRGEKGGSRRSYEAVVRGFCETGRMEEAAKVQAEMAGRGWEAGERVYEAFICGYERAGEFEMVERLGKEMVQMGLGREED